MELKYAFSLLTGERCIFIYLVLKEEYMIMISSVSIQ